MRSAHFCAVCDKRLPFCVRSDRMFCTSRCRVWAFRHPGQKRGDYQRGRVRLPEEPGRGRPKTLAAALAALEESRQYAAKLEATAQKQHSAEQALLNEVSTLRTGLGAVKLDLAAERDSAREMMAEAQERLGKTEEQKNKKTKESYKRRRQAERLQSRLKRAESELSKKRSELGRAQADLEEARRTQAQRSIEQESELRAIRAQVAELSLARAELTRQIKELTASAEKLQSRAEQSEQVLQQRDEELTQERKKTPDAELLRRRLAAEQERRMAAEQRIEQLLCLSGLAKKAPEPASPSASVVSSGALGQYQRHAVAAEYDPDRDPLFALMRQDVLIADRYSDWQARNMERVTSRRRNLSQTLEEQTYAATLAARWRLLDHPHQRPGTIPTWSRLGYLLDDKSEKYLLTITQERIDEMQSRLGKPERQKSL